MAATAAAVTLVGVLLSGPVSFAIVELTHPQPAWNGAADFVASYHPIQLLPYWTGFVLVVGSALLIGSLHGLTRRPLRARATCALVFVAAFAALIVSNYVVQTTFVPQLVHRSTLARGVVIDTFAMANPTSLAWCIEMWGYALLGVATWLIAPVFDGTRLERATQALFVANGPISIAAAVVTAIAPRWLMTTPGLVSYLLWNLLIAAMTGLAFVALRRRLGA